MARGKTIGFEHFARFTDEFESHCSRSHHIMDVPLLYMIKNAFGYDIISLTNYQGRRFCGVEIIGDIDIPVIKEYYVHTFQKRDPFAAHINRVCAKDDSISMLQSSEVFGGSNYDNNDYYRFLHHYGIAHALTIPVAGYRLTVYKKEGEQDFTSREHDAMKLLATQLRTRYKSSRTAARQAAVSDAQSSLLDSLGVGFLTLRAQEGQLGIQQYNQTGREFLRASGEGEQQAVSQLFQRIHQGGRRMLGQHRALWMEQAGRTFIWEELDTGLPGEEFYTLTIYPQERPSQRLDGEKLIRRYNLSAREIEIARLLVGGCSYQEAAARLFISINTVRTHVRNIYKKTGITNQRMLGLLFA